ncbi:hypothetical protein WICPIJ_010070 [Wickerhamomyces pijperi]|uniref:3-oxoacyl-[acyl-carrier-protein] reductase n=1 Tax=Wickerhamomyces pijperi TaxID=599730 RepID=A0A9P8PH94_WICPI|nr:hypothetical protein WICPIJ_010070 [Wickerhamomyces pijperi]
MTRLNVYGKVVAITGGSRGLGLHCAEILVKNGAKSIYITARKQKGVDDAIQYLQKIVETYKDRDQLYHKGQDIIIRGIPADVSTGKGVVAFLNLVQEKETQVDILIANAGASWGAPLDQHPEAAIDKVLELNIKGVFLTIQKFKPLLVKAGNEDYSARILIMGSVAGITPTFGGEGGTYGYLASKAGVAHMGKMLALELGPQNVNVNIIAPGFFPSKMSNGLLEGEFGQHMISHNPKRRIGKQSDIENAILFFAARESDYINGAVIPIDGGHHLGDSVPLSSGKL